MKKHFLVFLLLLITVCFWSCQVNITNEDIDTTDQKQSMGTTANDDLIDNTESSHIHFYSDATCTKAPTCACGAENGTALGHSYEQGICTRCNAIDPDYNPIPVSKQNALKKAKSYLNYSAFSYLGLIDQLEYEKFSHEDAVYAVDNCGADWNDQALKRAKSYLNHSSFSYQSLIHQLEYEKYTSEQSVYAADNCGANWNDQALKKAKSYLYNSAFSYKSLIQQLEYEKYTSEQAIYAADNCGANWNEQAAKKAKSYLNHSSFSRQGLIEQLEYEGFTHEQAVYGVDSVGL